MTKSHHKGRTITKTFVVDNTHQNLDFMVKFVTWIIVGYAEKVKCLLFLACDRSGHFWQGKLSRT